MDARERAEWETRVCPECGSEVRTEWKPEPRLGAEMEYVPDRFWCTNPACDRNDPHGWPLGTSPVPAGDTGR